MKACAGKYLQAYGLALGYKNSGNTVDEIGNQIRWLSWPIGGMNALMYCLSSVSGGAVSYIRNLAPLLLKEFVESSDGHRLKFLAHEEQRPWFGTVDDQAVLWVRGRIPSGYHRIAWEWHNMQRIVTAGDFYLCFTPYQLGPKLRGIKQVLMIRNMEPFLFASYPYGLAARLRNLLLARASESALRSADRVIAVSRFANDFLTREIGVGSNRVRSIRHGRDERFAERAGIDQDRDTLNQIGVGNRFIFTCGSLLPYRRCEDVIAGFEICSDSLGTGTQLVIAGTGTDRRYSALIARIIRTSSQRDRILAVGHVSSETMRVLYRRCLLCVMATEIEACPNIAIEAMTSGCAVVSSDRPPLPEMFAGASLEYRARDVRNLAEQIRLLLERDDLRQALKQRARLRATTFSWETCARETYRALTEW